MRVSIGGHRRTFVAIVAFPERAQSCWLESNVRARNGYSDSRAYAPLMSGPVTRRCASMFCRSRRPQEIALASAHGPLSYPHLRCRVRLMHLVCTPVMTTTGIRPGPTRGTPSYLVGANHSAWHIVMRHARMPATCEHVASVRLALRAALVSHVTTVAMRAAITASPHPGGGWIISCVAP